MSDFAVVINYQFEGESPEIVVLDTVEDVQVNSNSRITTQPTVTGDEISDHIFREPKTLTLNGTCSLNGSQAIVVNGSGSKLANFEDLFERIQREGVLCDIMKISIRNENDVRFLKRVNMALKSLSWNEGINSLNFSMGFQEVIAADVIDYNVYEDDEFLPNVSSPNTLSFTDSGLFDWTQVQASVIEILKKEDLITQNFLNAAASVTISGVIIASAIALAIALNATPVGWVITAVGCVFIFVNGIIKAIQNAIRRKKYLVEVFDITKNEKKNEEQMKRFREFMEGINNELKSLDNLISAYQVSSNEAQEAMISVGDEYYIFTFTWDNLNHVYKLSIENIDKSNNKYLEDVKSGAKKDISELNSGDSLIVTNNNSKIFLVCPSELEEDRNDLTNYYITIWKMNPEDLQKAIEDIIKSKIFRGYEKT